MARYGCAPHLGVTSMAPWLSPAALQRAVSVCAAMTVLVAVTGFHTGRPSSSHQGDAGQCQSMSVSP